MCRWDRNMTFIDPWYIKTQYPVHDKKRLAASYVLMSYYSQLRNVPNVNRKHAIMCDYLF